MVNPRTGKVLGADEEPTSGRPGMPTSMLSASHVGPPRCQRRRLPAINPGTSNRNRFISRSLKRELCGVGASRIRNHHGPLIAAGARKNEKLNTVVVHGTRHYHV